MNFILQHLDILFAVLCMIVWLVIDIVRAIKSKNFGTLKQKLIDVMEYVEQYTMANGETLDGEYKLAFAKALLINECEQRHLSYNEEQITAIIEKLIDFSKKVNYNKKGDENKDD